MQEPSHENSFEKDINNIMKSFYKVIRAVNQESFMLLQEEKIILNTYTLEVIEQFRITYQTLFNNNPKSQEYLALYMLQKLVHHYALAAKCWDFDPDPCSLLEDGILSYALRFVATKDAQRFSQGLSFTMDIDGESLLDCIPESRAADIKALFTQGLWKPQNPHKEAPGNSTSTRNHCEFYTTLTQPSFEFNLDGCFVDFITGNARISPLYARGFRLRAVEAHKQLQSYILEKALYVDNSQDEPEMPASMGYCSIL